MFSPEIPSVPEDGDRLIADGRKKLYFRSIEVSNYEFKPVFVYFLVPGREVAVIPFCPNGLSKGVVSSQSV